MNTHLARIGLVVCHLLLAKSDSFAQNKATGAEFADAPRVEILEPARRACAGRAKMCMTAGDSSTVAANSGAHGKRGYFMATSSPRFVRAATIATNDGDAYPVDDAIPWTIEISATLRHRALAGNAVFLVYDAGNPKSLSTHEVTGAWQAKIPAGDRLAARLILSPREGFRAGHTYRIRVVQIVHGKEDVLAEGQVSLQ